MKDNKFSLEHILELNHIRRNFGLKEAFYYDLSKTNEDIFNYTSSIVERLIPIFLKVYFISSFLYYELRKNRFNY